MTQPVGENLIVSAISAYFILMDGDRKVTVESESTILVNDKRVRVHQCHYDEASETMALVNVDLAGCDFLTCFLYNKTGINCVMFQAQEILPFIAYGETVFAFDNMVPISKILHLVKLKFTLSRSHGS